MQLDLMNHVLYIEYFLIGVVGCRLTRILKYLAERKIFKRIVERAKVSAL